MSSQIYLKTTQSKLYIFTVFTYKNHAAVIYSFIPLTLLIIFNILIVHNLIKASNNIQKLQSSSSANNNTNYCKKRKFSICFLFSCNKSKYSTKRTISNRN